jgi:hypothetical protein
MAGEINLIAFSRGSTCQLTGNYLQPLSMHDTVHDIILLSNEAAKTFFAIQLQHTTSNFAL